MSKPIYFTTGFFIGLVIVAIVAGTCFKTYDLLTHGEGLGKAKYFARKILEWKADGEKGPGEAK